MVVTDTAGLLGFGAMGEPKQYDRPGPFRVDSLRDGDRYELVDGHPLYCNPTGGQGGRAEAAGARAVTTDPAVTESGIDVGYSGSPRDLRAPDIAVGNVPDARGWVKGAPPLAIEYAGEGQNEDDLARKIPEFFALGTKYVWVVRLLGPRRVEVHEPEKPPVVYGPGTEIVAPGVLKNPVPVEALWDVDASNRVALRNLLQRAGYADLDAVRDEGREEGREEAARALLDLADALGLPLDEPRAASVRALDLSEIRRLRESIKRDRTWPAG